MKSILFISFLTSLLLSGCTSSKITSSWTAKNLESRDYKKIMVIGVFNKERNLQQQIENHISDDLKALGYVAHSAFDEYGPKAFQNLDEEAALEKLQADDVDAVMTIVLLDKEKERYYVPGRVVYTPYVIYHNRFWRYYTTIYDRVYTPGYFAESTHYFWESNFYDLKTKELLYSVQTESFDPASAASMAHEYGQMIVKDMIKHQVLTRKVPASAAALQ